MTVASLMQRLKSGGAVPPVPPWNPGGGTAKNAIFRGEMPSVPPVPPQKTVAKNKVVPPDPGMAQLLALADRYCTAIQASDKTRADWRSDLEATPPEQHGALAAYLRSQLPAPSRMVQATPSHPAPAQPLPKFHSAQPWRVADKAYQAYHWQCPTCKAAARSGHSERCATGQQLHDLYEQAFDEAGKKSHD